MRVAASSVTTAAAQEEEEEEEEKEEEDEEARVDVECGILYGVLSVYWTRPDGFQSACFVTRQTGPARARRLTRPC